MNTATAIVIAVIVVLAAAAMVVIRRNKGRSCGSSCNKDDKCAGCGQEDCPLRGRKEE